MVNGVRRELGQLADAQLVRERLVPLRRRLEEVLDGLTDDLARAPSVLPGWTRGHVLAHLTGLGSAIARQAEYTRVDERIDFYDGGQAGRTADIEARAGRSAAVHSREVRTAALRVEAAFAAQTEGTWSRPTGNRGRTVAQLAESWWRELAIHLTDLDLGVGYAVWTPDLLDHLADYLAGRVPRGTRLELIPVDGVAGPWDLGDHAVNPIVLRGTAADLVAWLAGRAPEGSVTTGADGPSGADGGTEPLPALLDQWP